MVKLPIFLFLCEKNFCLIEGKNGTKNVDLFRNDDYNMLEIEKGGAFDEAFWMEMSYGCIFNCLLCGQFFILIKN